MLVAAHVRPSLPVRWCLLRPFSGPLVWRPLFLSVCASCAYSLAFWAGSLFSYPLVLVAPILWPSGLAASVPIRLCFLRLFSGLLGWLPLFLSVCACCAYSLTLWAGVLCSHPFVLLAPILWPFVLACSLFIRFCLLRLFSGPLGWRPLFPRPLCGVGSEKIPDVEVAVEKAEDHKLTVVDGKHFAGSGRDVPKFSSARREASLPLSKKICRRKGVMNFRALYRVRELATATLRSGAARLFTRSSLSPLRNGPM